MNKKVMKKVRIIVVLVVVIFLVWFFGIQPFLQFRSNEARMENAARRYFELNPNELPTGERVKTISLNTLYHQSYIEGDIYIPHTKKVCSITDSWVKVRKENNQYKYYTYLKCGVLSSLVDHQGPKIELNGEEQMTINVGEKYKEPGINSVVDNKDGKLSVQEVTVKGNVDTSKIGTYTVQYIAFDNLNNKTIVEREIQVVKKLNGTIKNILGKSSNFKGNPTDNYIRLSHMDFRIYGIDSNNNVIVVADEDVANVNYSKLDEWLKYYYNHLNENTQKLIVESRYCNMKLTAATVDTTVCSEYTAKKKVYIPSAIEVNKAEQDGNNYMKPHTMSWVSNAASKNTAYLTRNIFYAKDNSIDKEKSFEAYPMIENYGVRPMMTINGETLIVGGDGTKDNPYVVGDTKKAKGSTPIGERETGEYIKISQSLWRVVEAQEDGTVKVISDFVLGYYDDAIYIYDPTIYDTKDKNNLGYYINNKITTLVDTSYFANHTTEVPIYEDAIVYGKEVKTKKVKGVLFAPNMYEMFSAQPYFAYHGSYWLINSSNHDKLISAISSLGVPTNNVEGMTGFGIRLVAYLKKGVVVTSGDGTYQKPYVIQ